MNNQNNSNKPQRTRCEVWSRVMGYHRPVSCSNLGKKSEHYSRQHFSETATINSNFCKTRLNGEVVLQFATVPKNVYFVLDGSFVKSMTI